MYKRLTMRNNGDIDTNCKNCKQCQKVGRKYICNDMTACDEEIINRLAELEDKIERGELVENTVVTYVNMARTNSKTLIDKALKFDELKAKIENGTLIELNKYYLVKRSRCNGKPDMVSIVSDAVKETAEKFESELKAFIKVWKMAEDDAMSTPFYRALFEKIGELAKQFGVEIKE